MANSKRTSMLVGLSVGLLFWLLPLSASAEMEGRSHRLAADAGVVIPVGDWSDVTGMGIGAMFRYEYLLSPSLTITARVGYLHGLAKDVLGADYSMSELPVLAGVRYFVLGSGSLDSKGLYAGMELGFVGIRVRAQACGWLGCIEANDFETKFGMTVGVGYEISRFDMNAGVFLPSVADAGDMVGVLLTIGYAFAAL